MQRYLLRRRARVQSLAASTNQAKRNMFMHVWALASQKNAWLVCPGQGIRAGHSGGFVRGCIRAALQ